MSEPGPQEERAPYSPAYTGYVLGMVLLVMIFSNIDRTILSILVRPIKAEFELTDTQMGWLLGPAFAIVYAILVAPRSDAMPTRPVIRRNIVAVEPLRSGASSRSRTATRQDPFPSSSWRGWASASARRARRRRTSRCSRTTCRPSVAGRGMSVISMGAVDRHGPRDGRAVAGSSDHYGWRAAFLGRRDCPGLVLALLVPADRFASPTRGAQRGSPVASVPLRLPAEPESDCSLRRGPTSSSSLANAFSLFASMGRNLWEPQLPRAELRDGRVPRPACGTS